MLRTLTAAALGMSSGEQNAEAILHAWAGNYHSALARYRKVLVDLQLAGTLDAAMLTVALREIRSPS